MANNNPNSKRGAITIFALMLLVLVLILGLIIGVVITLADSPFGNNSTSSIISDTTSIKTSSENVSSEVSSEVSSDASSATSSNKVSSQTPSTNNVSSVVSQEPVVPTGKKVVYLTFDDGPSKNTPLLLDTLDQLGVKATFFVVGNAVNAYPQYLTEIVNRGHQVALHAYQHDYDVIYQSEEAYFNDLQKISDLVYNWTGIRTNIIRFPGGSSNQVSKKYCPGIMTSLTKKVIEKGYQYYDWNVDSLDADGKYAKPTTPKDIIINNVKKYTPKSVNLLMHDTYYKTSTIEALPEIVEYYRNLGYEFDIIDEDADVCHHGKLNN